MENHPIWNALSLLHERIARLSLRPDFQYSGPFFHKGIFVVGVHTTFQSASAMRYLDVRRTTLTEIVGTSSRVPLVVADDKLLAG